MRITNESGLPEALVAAITNDPYPTGRTGDISVTRLIDSPRIRVLTKRYGDQITEDASNRIWSLLGQAVHTILERGHHIFEPAMVERRLFAEVDGWQVSGQFDRIGILEGGTLQDYKTTSVWSVIHGLKPEWEAQLNALAFLARLNKVPVAKLEIVAILRDWSRGKAKAGGEYPSQQVKVLPIPLWDKRRAANYLLERVQLHRAAEQLLDDALPECTPAERWQSPSVYAVKKPGRKSAIKLYDTAEAAERQASELGGTHYVEHRPGGALRCADYCAVAPFCGQWHAEQARQTAAEPEAACG